MPLRPVVTKSKVPLEGKSGIVTGSRQGIGKEVALALASAGANVVVCDHIAEDGNLETVAEEIRKRGRHSLAIKVDVSCKTEVDNLIQRVVYEFGTIDILVNNAGIIIRTPLMETPEKDWDRIIDTDLKGYYLCAQAAAKIMIQRKTGNIVNIASTLGMKAAKNTGAYCIAKAGILMLTRVLALELSDSNVRVNAVAPGLVQTEFSRTVWSDPEGRKQREAMIPLGRMAEPDDIVGSVLFLASDAARYITGQTIVIDGGVQA